MEEQFFELNSPEFETIVVILDASESAENDRPTIVEFAKKIFKKTPVDVKKRLFFLSNPQEYDIEKFEDNIAKWLNQNSKKGSFITPILSQIENAKIVIIGSGIIYDLEDWTTSEISKKLFFVKTSESMRGDLEIGSEIDRGSFDGQLSNLYNRILSVRISGNEFVPYYWDNPNYTIPDEGDIVLEAFKSENFSVRIAAYGENIKASVVKVEGTENIPLIATAKPDLLDNFHLIENFGINWEKLENDEEMTFKKHISSEKTDCPKCGNIFSGALKCDNSVHGSLLGRPIYESLKKIKGFIIFKERPEGVYYKKYTSNIVKIGYGTVARNKRFKAVISRYDPHSKKWVEQEDLPTYFPLAEGYYVSFV